jgi:hypothetical protein
MREGLARIASQACSRQLKRRGNQGVTIEETSAETGLDNERHSITLVKWCRMVSKRRQRLVVGWVSSSPNVRVLTDAESLADTNAAGRRRELKASQRRGPAFAKLQHELTCGVPRH